MPRWFGLFFLILALVTAAQLPRALTEALALQRGIAAIVSPRAGEEVACPTPDQKPLVLLALGQSNAANGVNERQTGPRITTFYAGRCYRGGDPLAGASGTGGAIWTYLAPRLEQRTGRPVVFALLAVGAQPIDAFLPDALLGQRLRALVQALRTAHLSPAAILWLQGENESRLHTPVAAYVDKFVALATALRAEGLTVPLIPAQATRCFEAHSPALAEAQDRLSQRYGGVSAPNLDAFGPYFRWDGCHFNEAGAQAAAAAWLKALTDAKVIIR